MRARSPILQCLTYLEATAIVCSCAAPRACVRVSTQCVACAACSQREEEGGREEGCWLERGQGLLDYKA